MTSCIFDSWVVQGDASFLRHHEHAMRLSTLQVVESPKLSAVPRFPAALAKDLGASQLAALVNLHVRALRMSLQLVASTRPDHLVLQPLASWG